MRVLQSFEKRKESWRISTSKPLRCDGGKSENTIREFGSGVTGGESG